MEKANYSPKRLGTIKKYMRIQSRFSELYESKRLRYDDVIKQLQDEFFIERPETVMRILRTTVELPSNVPNQMKLFKDELPKS